MNTIISMDNKGGVGKTLVSELVSSTAAGLGLKVARRDTDTANSSFATIYPDAKRLRIEETNVKAAGELAAAVLDAADSKVDLLQIDTGARDEARIVRAFDEILKASAEIGGRVVVMRPINLNLAVHNNALKFAKNFAMDGRVSVIFVPSVACGRSLADFDLVWKKLELREKLIELPNVDQFYLEDLGAVFAENMSLARCPLRDIVAGRFNIAPDAPSYVRERLETIYDRAARIHIAKWLQVHEARCADALANVGGIKARSKAA